MAQDEFKTGFFIKGHRTSLYLQKELDAMIENAICKHPGLFKSRNHFVNCAIARELRRLKTLKPEIETE